eukprot:TRINITY_DN45_c5_g1_i4.p1 TRINITY_DN45_c5_g1~~TRINITY_DN45_c5_g1_i4.p1  ORF type:complete len:1150 (+),score=400.74 TRINITY_DN45_c5_g1_i4:120-3569(+)
MFKKLFGTWKRKTKKSGRAFAVEKEDISLVDRSFFGIESINGALCIDVDVVQKLIAIGFSNGAIHVLGQRGVYKRLMHEKRPAGIRHIAWVPNTGGFVAVTSDGFIQMWDAETGRVVGEKPVGRYEITCLMVMPTGDLRRTCFVGTSSGEVVLFNTARYYWSTYYIPFVGDEKIDTESIPTEAEKAWRSVVDIVPHPTEHGILMIAYSSGAVAAWDIPTKSRISHLKAVEEKESLIAEAVCMAVHPDGDAIALGFSDGYIKIWKLRMKKPMKLVAELFPVDVSDGVVNLQWTRVPNTKATLLCAVHGMRCVMHNLDKKMQLVGDPVVVVKHEGLGEITKARFLQSSPIPEQHSIPLGFAVLTSRSEILMSNLNASGPSLSFSMFRDLIEFGGPDEVVKVLFIDHPTGFAFRPETQFFVGGVYGSDLATGFPSSLITIREDGMINVYAVDNERNIVARSHSIGHNGFVHIASCVAPHCGHLFVVWDYNPLQINAFDVILGEEVSWDLELMVEEGFKTSVSSCRISLLESFREKSGEGERVIAILEDRKTGVTMFIGVIRVPSGQLERLISMPEAEESKKKPTITCIMYNDIPGGVIPKESLLIGTDGDGAFMLNLNPKQVLEEGKVEAAEKEEKKKKEVREEEEEEEEEQEQEEEEEPMSVEIAELIPIMKGERVIRKLCVLRDDGIINNAVSVEKSVHAILLPESFVVELLPEYASSDWKLITTDVHGSTLWTVELLPSKDVVVHVVGASQPIRVSWDESGMMSPKSDEKNEKMEKMEKMDRPSENPYLEGIRTKDTPSSSRESSSDDLLESIQITCDIEGRMMVLQWGGSVSTLSLPEGCNLVQNALADGYGGRCLFRLDGSFEHIRELIVRKDSEDVVFRASGVSQLRALSNDGKETSQYLIAVSEKSVTVFADDGESIFSDASLVDPSSCVQFTSYLGFDTTLMLVMDKDLTSLKVFSLLPSMTLLKTIGLSERVDMAYSFVSHVVTRSFDGEIWSVGRSSLQRSKLCVSGESASLLDFDEIAVGIVNLSIEDPVEVSKKEKRMKKLGESLWHGHYESLEKEREWREGEAEKKVEEEKREKEKIANEAQSAAKAAAEARDLLRKRGERLDHMEDQSEELANESENFYEMCRQLREHYEGKSKKKKK